MKLTRGRRVERGFSAPRGSLSSGFYPLKGSRWDGVTDEAVDSALTQLIRRQRPWIADWCPCIPCSACTPASC